MAEGTSSHTEADGSGGSFPPFDPGTFPSQLVSLAIAFVALSLTSLQPANAAVVVRHGAYYGPNVAVKHVGYTRVTPYGVKHVGYTRVW